jgi:hypothetical protein
MLLEPVGAHTASEVVVQERLLERPLLHALRPYQAPAARSSGVVIREGHTGCSSVPSRVKKEASMRVKKEVKDEPVEMPAPEED